jgi:ABC-type dipeptide/oligopeptide/nickel transport system ATPase component
MYHIADKPKYSKCGWTPFAGKEVFGEIKRVVIRGKTVFVDGMFIDSTPSGVNVRCMSDESTRYTQTLLQQQPQPQSQQSQLQQLQQLQINTVNVSESFKQELTIQHLCSKWKKLHINHILSADQFDTKSLKIIFEMADIMKLIWEKKEKCDLLAGKMMAAIFYEPSTRTRCSFSAAMQKLGGEVIDISSDVSSVQKGETLEDFVRCMQCYADVIVLRSNIKDSAKKAAEVMDKHLINAGDGCGEHPSQAILG